MWRKTVQQVMPHFNLNVQWSTLTFTFAECCQFGGAVLVSIKWPAQKSTLDIWRFSCCRHQSFQVTTLGDQTWCNSMVILRGVSLTIVALFGLVTQWPLVNEGWSFTTKLNKVEAWGIVKHCWFKSHIYPGSGGKYPRWFGGGWNKNWGAKYFKPSNP